MNQRKTSYRDLEVWHKAMDLTVGVSADRGISEA